MNETPNDEIVTTPNGWWGSLIGMGAVILFLICLVMVASNKPDKHRLDSPCGAEKGGVQ